MGFHDPEALTSAPRGFFPGSKVPLPTDEAPAEPPRKKRQDAHWDSHPVKKVIKGVETELFPIGAVCTALGRPAVTIRHWIRKGYIPAATFRMPNRVSRNGHSVAGRRLYTRHQVESLVRVAEEHQILGKDRIEWNEHTGFADAVRAAWATTPID